MEYLNVLARGKYDAGECKQLKIKCVSERGWFDDEKLTAQIRAAGGSETNQWKIPWDKENAAGSCSLIEVETTDEKSHKFLMDTGWNPEYIDKCFKREGIDKMLKKGEIEFLFISHEHMDHFWGLEAVLKYNPEIKILIPATFYPEAIAFIKGEKIQGSPAAKNSIPHKGELIQISPEKIFKIYEGVAAALTDLPIMIRVRGEQSLFFNIKNKGMVCVTGCCHQNILNLADFAMEKFVGAKNIYGVYGGLHISPFGSLNSEKENIIQQMGKYNFKKIACNHCTGLPAVKRMIELGYPVVGGSGNFASKTNLHVGDGDEVFFG